MYSASGSAPVRSCELKSQYGHLRTHQGMCTYSASGGNAASFTTPGRSTTTGFIQEGHELLEREAAMADAILVLRVQLSGRLAEFSYQEQRVVSKAVRAARCARDLAVPYAFGDQGFAILGVSHQHHHASVVGTPVVLQVPQKLLVVAAIARLAAAVTTGVVGRMHARLATERGNAQAGIVGQCRQAGGATRVARL